MPAAALSIVGPRHRSLGSRNPGQLTSSARGLDVRRRPLRGGVDRNSAYRTRLVKVRLSPPARGRGSKRLADLGLDYGADVAPCAGAWIETPRRGPAGWRGRRPLRGGVDRNFGVHRRRRALADVAPCAGAWIETPRRSVLARPCRPLRGGVDRNSSTAARRSPRAGSRPLRGGVDRNRRSADRPAQELGRPLRGGVDRNASPASTITAAAARRPLRGGVDRNSIGRQPRRNVPVAPCAGAWIETIERSARPPAPQRRPLRGGVDRNIAEPRRSAVSVRGRPLRGGVDRNSGCNGVAPACVSVAPCAGAWIETTGWPPRR